MDNIPFDNRSFFVNGLNRLENIDEDIENRYNRTQREIPSKLKQELSSKLYEIQSKRIQKLIDFYEHQIQYLTETYDLIIDSMDKTIHNQKITIQEKETKIAILQVVLRTLCNSQTQEADLNGRHDSFLK